MFQVPLTGASMNPARSFGPAVVVGDYVNSNNETVNSWDNHWVSRIYGGFITYYFSSQKIISFLTLYWGSI